MNARVLGFAALLVGTSACTGSADRCVTDNDCFFGEVCRDRQCGPPIVEIDRASDADAAFPPSDASDSRDAEMVEPRDDGNTTTPDDGSPDDVAQMPDASAPDLPAEACVVDPFDQCFDDEDPDNNDFPGASLTNMTRGCQSSGFVPLDMTISGRMCALDPEDQYYITIVECDADEPGMIIEATLDVKDGCDPDLVHFDVESIGTTCADPNPDSDLTLRCQTLADGRRQISVIWPGDAVPQVGSIRWSIQTPDRDDVQFDYDFRVVVREP